MVAGTLQGLSRKQFEAIRPDFGRMHAASTDGAVFAVALTVQADEAGTSAPLLGRTLCANWHEIEACPPHS